ncbi:MAG: hypothetical protein L0L01_08470, partial [Bifidobacterium crudilactis]|nr:hypothetical protein [Bifidobacterium crudilactis]
MTFEQIKIRQLNNRLGYNENEKGILESNHNLDARYTRQLSFVEKLSGHLDNSLITTLFRRKNSLCHSILSSASYAVRTNIIKYIY